MPFNLSTLTVKEVQSLNALELTELILQLESVHVGLLNAKATEDEVKETERPLATLWDTAKLAIKDLQQKQKKQYKSLKDLPPNLSVYLSNYFPSISFITTPEKMGHKYVTPLALAIDNKDIRVIRELIDTFGADCFCEVERDYTFRSLAYSELLVDVINELSKSVYRDRPLLFILLENAYNPIPQSGQLFLSKMQISYASIMAIQQIKPLLPSFSDNSQIFEKTATTLLNNFGTKHQFIECKHSDEIISTRIKELIDLYLLSTTKEKNNESKAYHDLLRKLFETLPDIYEMVVANSIGESLVIQAARVHDAEMVSLLFEFCPKLNLTILIPWIKMHAGRNDFLDHIIDFFGKDKLITLLTNDYRLNFAEYSLEIIARLYSHFEPLTETQKINFASLMKKVSPQAPQKQLFTHITKKKLEIKYQLDDKTFAHIHNDHSLAGTTLVGSTTAESLQVLHHFLKERIQLGNESKVDTRIVLNLQHYKTKLDECLLIEQMMSAAVSAVILDTKEISNNWYRTRKDFFEKMVTELSNTIFSKLQESKDGDLLIPGGWRGNGRPGHAMLYEIRHTPTGYAFLIHNSGAGLARHKTRMTKNGLKYSTLKAYTIPTRSVDSFAQQFKLLFKTLIVPQVLPACRESHANYDEDRLYNEIEATTKTIGLTETHPNVFYNKWTRGQLSGTCAWRVFRSYLQSVCRRDNVNYSLFSLDIKSATLAEYYSKNKARHEDVVCRQMSFSLQNLARHLEALKSSDYKEAIGSVYVMSSADLFRATLSLIPIIELDLATRRASSTTTAVELHSYHSTSHSLKRPARIQVDESSLIDLTYRIGLEDVNSGMTFTTSELIKIPTSDGLFPFEEKKPVESFNRVYYACVVDYQNKYFTAVTNTIEKFYLKLPIEFEFWGPFHQSELIDCIFALRRLNALYMASISQRNCIPFPDQVTTLLTGVCLGQGIMRAYFKHSPLILHPGM